MFSKLLNKFLFGVVVVFTPTCFAADTKAPDTTTTTAVDANKTLTPAQIALKRLLDGNKLYVKEMLEHPNRSQERRVEVSDSHTPFAVIVGCSDSRASPIIIFDQGIGDLFEVRVAGNVVGPIEIASVDYAVDHLKASLIFVLGHGNCGAVKAVLDKQTKGIEPIAVKIQSAIKDGGSYAANPLENAIKANVHATVKQLRDSEVIAKLIKDKKVQVVGGYYDLNTGEVELCCDLPKESPRNRHR